MTWQFYFKYLLSRRLDGVIKKEISDHTGIQTPVVQPVASH
jgi:hypothetical protein